MLTIPGFPFGSAAEVLDDDTGEEGDGVEVGFGFGRRKFSVILIL
jgi:hypothetical protein